MKTADAYTEEDKTLLNNTPLSAELGSGTELKRFGNTDFNRRLVRETVGGEERLALRVLGFSAKPDRTTIRKRYQKLVLTHRPDKAGTRNEA